eukprot:3489511-Amphidinium_carterae.2
MMSPIFTGFLELKIRLSLRVPSEFGSKTSSRQSERDLGNTKLSSEHDLKGGLWLVRHTELVDTWGGLTAAKSKALNRFKDAVKVQCEQLLLLSLATAFSTSHFHGNTFC